MKFSLRASSLEGSNRSILTVPQRCPQGGLALAHPWLPRTFPEPYPNIHRIFPEPSPNLLGNRPRTFPERCPLLHRVPPESPWHMHIFQMKYAHFGSAVNRFNPCMTLIWSHGRPAVPPHKIHVSPYMDPLGTHIRFKHISNEILTFWISGEHIYTYLQWNIKILH